MKKIILLSIIVAALYWAKCCKTNALSTILDPTVQPKLDINNEGNHLDDNEKIGRMKLLAALNDPSKIVLKPGASHLLSCSSLVGANNITLIWMKDGIEIKRAVDQRNILYQLDYLEQVDNGCYSCMAIFKGVTTDRSSIAEQQPVYKDMKETCITVVTRPILEVSQLYNSLYYDIGQKNPIELSCKAYSLMDLSYEWFGDSANSVEDVRTPTLILHNFNSSYSHTYHCIVSNKVGKTIKWFHLIPKMKLDSPHIISTQLTQKHIIINVLTKRVHMYGGQLMNFLVNCGNSTMQSSPTDKPYIMIPYIAATINTEYIECSVQLESVSKMLSDKVNIKVAIEKQEVIPTDGNLYFGSLSPAGSGKVQFSYWLTPKTQKNAQKRKSQIYLSIKSKKNTDQAEIVKLIEYNTNQSEGIVEIGALELNTNYTIKLLERGEFLNDKILASPIDLFMPNDKDFIEKQNMFYPEIREITLKSYESIIIKVYFYEENPEFRVILCDCCQQCSQTHYQIIQNSPNDNLVTIYINKLIPLYDYVIKINYFPSTFQTWLQSYEKPFTMPKKIIPMPRNVLILIDDSLIKVSFQVSSANNDIRGTVVLVQYSDISMKYYVPTTKMKTSIPLRKGYIIFNIRVYHFNSESVGESFTKYVYSEIIEKNPKMLVYSALFLVVAGILLMIIAIFVYYACKDPYKESKFKKYTTLVCSEKSLDTNNDHDKSLWEIKRSVHFTQSDPDLSATDLSTQTNINIKEFAFDLHDFTVKLNFLIKSSSHLLIYEYKMLKKLTKNVQKPHQLPSNESQFNMREFKPDSQVHYILLNSPKVNEYAQFWTVLQELSPCLVISLETTTNSNQINNYWDNSNISPTNSTISLDVNIKKHYNGCIHREIKLHNKCSLENYEFNHIEYLDWSVNSFFPACYGSYGQLQKLILLALINNPHKPIVLHCKNGVDKCGTTVALSYIIKRYSNTEEINFIQEISEITNRNNFYLINDWRYLMSVYCGCYELLAYSHLTLKVDNFNRSLLATECKEAFNHLKVTSNKKIANKFSNYSKNNNNKYIPFDKNIPYIFEPSSKFPLYINASWIRNNNYHINDYIITQNPKMNTIDNFFSMIHQHSCSLIINANNLTMFDSYSPVPSNYIPIDEDIVTKNFRNHIVNAITPSINCHMKFCTLRQYNCVLSNTQENDKQQNLTIISIHTTPNQFTPDDDISTICKLILRIIDGRKKLSSTTTTYHPIVVHCVDGGPISGILVACCILIEQFLNFGYTNIPVVIRNLLRQRANLITTEKHYKSVFNIVKYFICHYIKSPHPSQSLSHSSQPYEKF